MGGLNVLFLSVSVVLLHSSAAWQVEHYDCGHNTACYRVPFECLSHGGYEDFCLFEVVWIQQKTTTKFKFTITAKTRPTGWVAVGFSSDKYMGEDDVLMCILEGGAAKFEHRYNNAGRTNVAAVTPAGSVVATATSYNNEVVVCRVEREISITNNNVVFDLLSSDWYMFFAHGSIVDGNPVQHDEIPIMTKEKIDFSKLVTIGPEQVIGLRNAADVTQAGMLLVLCTAVMAAFGVYQ